MASITGPNHTALLTVYNNLGLRGKAKGDALANLVAYVLERTPGVSDIILSRTDAFHAQEVDILFSQVPTDGGFPADELIPQRVFVECKNLSHPMSAIDVAWFYYKLQTRGRAFGMIFSSNGLTGSAGRRSAAQDVIKDALSHRVHIIAISGAELASWTSTDDLGEIVKRRITELVADRTIFC